MKRFQLVRGVRVPNLDGIHECYELTERANPSDGNPFYSFTMNISAEKLRPLLKRFCEFLDELGFFLCELPATQQEEAELRHSDTDPLHCNVYYKDGCSKAELLEILEESGAWFIEDGISSFGFASHHSNDEIYIGKYKVTTLFTYDAERYKALLNEFDIPQEEKIKTVWDNFTHENPGRASSIAIEGKTVYDIVDELLKNGLYLAERREER